MNTHEHLIESVLQTTQKFNCGSSIITLLPSFFYFFYFWRLSETYIIAYMNPIQRPRRLHRVPKGLWWKFWLKITLTSMLVWSGSQCWSDGLVPILKTYTSPILTMINNNLRPQFQMNQTTLQSLECICKLIVCYSVVALVRWCYIYVDNNYQYTRRRSRIRRIYNWRTLIPGRGTSELGEDGYLLMQTILPTEPQQPPELVENNNRKKVKLTQSCQLSTKFTSIIPKVIVRRKSV
ncbi:uncharacterized protein LOC111042380 [Myzus persicae]|uniref:uncharacterized protein LOC111042380 n=1 Tax=Myzus persicae TaxID=13164 RepID=UPI000B931BA5|nr:uncharacterized protein LOC111042380 [Myzus persicae]